VTDQIVLAYTPSRFMKDWQLRADGEHHWFYEQSLRFYDTGCKVYASTCLRNPPLHKRAVAKEPYYNIITKEETPAPRIYITHHPKKGEWENYKTADDVINSPLFISMEVAK
jgi:hypothetical protein